MSVDSFLFGLTGGMVLGALYAIMAAGLALSWTTQGIFNFSNGALIARGADVGWQFGNADAWALGQAAGLCATVLARDRRLRHYAAFQKPCTGWGRGVAF